MLPSAVVESRIRGLLSSAKYIAASRGMPILTIESNSTGEFLTVKLKFPDEYKISVTSDNTEYCFDRLEELISEEIYKCWKKD